MSTTLNSVDSLLDEAESLGFSDPERVLALAGEAEQRCREINGADGGDSCVGREARSRILQAGALRILGRHREALDQAGMARRLFETQDNTSGMANAEVITGAIYSLLGNNPKALEHCQRSLELVRGNGDILGQIKALNNLGIVYREIGEKERAIECYEEGYDLSGRSEEYGWAALYLLNNMGLVYRDLRDYATALDCFTQALQLDIPPERGGTGSTHCHIGEIKKLQQKYDEALSFYHRALDLCEEEKNQEYIITTLVNLGELHLSRDFSGYDLDRAESYLLHSLELSQPSHFSRMTARANRLLADIYEARGEPAKALRFFKTFHEITEEIRSEQASRKLADLRVAFDLDKSQREAEVVQHRNQELAKLNRQIEDQRHDLSKMNDKLQRLVREKSEFLSIAAHDLKSPLAVISGYAQLIQEEARDNPTEVREYANIVEITANRLSLLVLNLLDVNAIESGALQPRLKKLDLTLVVDAIVREFREQAGKKNIAITLDAPDAGCAFIGDHLAIEQVVRNLLSNAIKFSPHGSAVLLRIDETDTHARLRVIDSGPGIPEAEQPKLFRRFARLTPKPTGDEHSSGLGLYIVKQRLEAMHGSVRCESRPGDGTAFIVELPKA